MNNKNEIIKQYKKLIKNFIKHNKSYYVYDSPKISDSDYDKLKKSILDLEKKYIFLSEAGSIKTIVGSKPSNKFKKFKHLSPMLSLANAFNKEDMKDFLKKIDNFLNFNNQEIVLFCFKQGIHWKKIRPIISI